MTSQTLWFITRGAGIVTLLLLSAVVVLGILSRARFRTSSWPRFLTPALHRNLAVTAIVFLVIHIITAITDPFTHLGLVAALVPFGSYYRTLWLGLGTLSAELTVAVMASALLRTWIGPAWRAIHFVSYPLWIMAVAHTVGTGTDVRSLWMVGITIGCVLAVAIATLGRLSTSAPDPLAYERRGAAVAFRGGNR